MNEDDRKLKMNVIEAIRDHDNPDTLSKLLLDDGLWQDRSYDDFLIEHTGEHLVGLCLEHDSVACALYVIDAELPGCNLNATGPDGSGIEPPLMKALGCRSNSVVKALLDKGVEYYEGFEYITPLERALINSNYEGLRCC